MTRTRNAANLTAQQKKQLERTTSRKIREHTSAGTTAKNIQLINSFNKNEFDLYEQYLHKWGSPGRRREVMLTQMLTDGVSGPLVELATVRVNDLYEHQKIIQSLRYRWTDIFKHKTQKINSSPVNVWVKMATNIKARIRDFPRVHCPLWDGPGGKKALANFLETLYKKQNGLCALTGLPMEPKIGKDISSKCSIDRIDSQKGYFPDNMQLVVSWANSMKLDMSQELFFDRINIIAKHHYAKRIA